MSEPYRREACAARIVGRSLPSGYKYGDTGPCTRQVAAILVSQKMVAFCREMPDVCDAKRPLTSLRTLESVADGQFQAHCTLRACSGFDQF